MPANELPSAPQCNGKLTSDELKSIIDRLPDLKGKTKGLDKQIDTARLRAAAVWKTLRRIELDAEAEALAK